MVGHGATIGTVLFVKLRMSETKIKISDLLRRLIAFYKRHMLRRLSRRNVPFAWQAGDYILNQSLMALAKRTVHFHEFQAFAPGEGKSFYALLKSSGEIPAFLRIRLSSPTSSMSVFGTVMVCAPGFVARFERDID